MRVFPYILVVLVVAFTGNIVLSFAIPNYRNTLIELRSQAFPSMKEQGWIDVGKDRLSDSLDRIDEHIATLTEPSKNPPKTDTGTTQTGTVAISTASGTVQIPKVIEVPPKPPEIPVSWIFLAKIMPDIILKKTDDKGFFGIQIFTKIGYSTYIDERKNIKVYAFSENYDTLLVNLKLVNNMYDINETDQFFGFTFFLNPIKKDPRTVRFVTSLEWRAIGIEVPKSYYPTLRKILLKK